MNVLQYAQCTGETGIHITIMSQFIPLVIPNHTGLYK